MSFASVENVNANTLLNPADIITEENDQQEPSSSMRSLSIASNSSIDIHGKPIGSDILVALMDRQSEIKDLVVRNSQFYEAMEHYIVETQGKSAWQNFQDILYKPREKIPDRAWLDQITHYLSHNPVFLNKFKEFVGYEEDETDGFSAAQVAAFTAPPHKLPNPNTPSLANNNSSSSNNNSSRERRRSRRLSNMSDNNLDFNSDVTFEEINDSLFMNEDQFYSAANNGECRRRRASYHSIQSEPHPTFVESKIDEADEIDIEEGDQSDHLADLIDEESDDSENEDQHNTGSHYVLNKPRSDLDLIKLRNYPLFQQNLTHSHPAFFKKAKKLLSLAPSSRKFSAAIRRNSILEDTMPPSPVAELDEPIFQTVEEDSDRDEHGGNLASIVCCTRRQQPDDIAWLNEIKESFSGWPELVDRLHDIVNELSQEKDHHHR